MAHGQIQPASRLSAFHPASSRTAGPAGDCGSGEALPLAVPAPGFSDGGPTPSGRESALDHAPSRAGKDRNHVLATLRERIAAIEGEPACRLEVPKPEGMPARPVARRSALRLKSLGCAEADEALGGGFPASGLSELRASEARDGGSLAGFALALAILHGAAPGRPLVWIGDGLAFSEAGLPYRPGLSGLGFDPGALVLVRARRLEEAIWAAEEAAASKALAMAILETRGNPGPARPRRHAAPASAGARGGPAVPAPAPERCPGGDRRAAQTRHPCRSGRARSRPCRHAPPRRPPGLRRRGRKDSRRPAAPLPSRMELR